MLCVLSEASAPPRLGRVTAACPTVMLAVLLCLQLMKDAMTLPCYAMLGVLLWQATITLPTALHD